MNCNSNIEVCFPNYEPIEIKFPTQCNNIKTNYCGVEIPMSDEAFAKMIEAYFTNKEHIIIFDGGNADTILAILDKTILE